MKTKFDELLEFPCVQTFKIMGLACDNLADLVIAELHRLHPGDYSPSIKPSSKGNYHSLSIPVTVNSKEHMEAIYKKVSAIDEVRFVL